MGKAASKLQASSSPSSMTKTEAASAAVTDSSSSSDTTRVASTQQQQQKTATTTTTSAVGDDATAQYRRFRDELLGFALGESAFAFAERLYAEQPHSPAIMALLAETAMLYDKNKNKYDRGHWCDRLDLLQRGVDVSRQCIKENPDYGPCYRSYVLCATREAEALYHVQLLRGLGLVENFHAILRRGERAMALMPDDAQVPNALAAMCGRCAYAWYKPARWYAMCYGVPSRAALLRRSVQLSERAVAADPASLEYACRLAQAYYHAGDMANARRWYVKVRDEMPPQDLKDQAWQGIAHTALTTAFARPKWNVPFA